MNKTEYKSTVNDVADWIWGGLTYVVALSSPVTAPVALAVGPQKRDFSADMEELGEFGKGVLLGGFETEQSGAQIFVDALIGCIPVVGDITAVRDLIAIMVKMGKDPDKEMFGEGAGWNWLLFVVLILALIPVAGGVLKGVGKLLIKEGAAAAKVGSKVKNFAEILQYLHRYGAGDVIKWIKKLDLEQYTPDIVKKGQSLVKTLITTIDVFLKKLAGYWVPEKFISGVIWFRDVLVKLGKEIPNAVPDQVKKLNKWLKELQEQIYEGELEALGRTTQKARVTTQTTSGTTKTINAMENDLTLAEKATKAALELTPFPHSSVADIEGVVPKKVDKAGIRVNDFVRYWPWPNLECFGKKKLNLLKKFTGKVKATEWGEGAVFRIFCDASGPKETDPIILLFRSDGTVTSEGKAFMEATPRKGGKLYREQLAVLDSVSDNGYYVDLVVPKDGKIKGFQGKTAGQIDDIASSPTYGQKLKGGMNRVVIDWNFGGNEAYFKSIFRNFIPDTLKADSRAVHGFMPKPGTRCDGLCKNMKRPPESELKGITFDDPNWAYTHKPSMEEAARRRIEYFKQHEEERLKLSKQISDAEKSGKSEREIGEEVVNRRNQDRFDDRNKVIRKSEANLKELQEAGASADKIAKAQEGVTKAKGALDDLKSSNMKTYKKEFGPSYDDLLRDKGTHKRVLMGAFASNLDADILFGLHRPDKIATMKTGFMEFSQIGYVSPELRENIIQQSKVVAKGVDPHASSFAHTAHSFQDPYHKLHLFHAVEKTKEEIEEMMEKLHERELERSSHIQQVNYSDVPAELKSNDSGTTSTSSYRPNYFDQYDAELKSKMLVKQDATAVKSVVPLTVTPKKEEQSMYPGFFYVKGK